MQANAACRTPYSDSGIRIMASLDASTIRARMVRIRSRAQGKAVRLTQETKHFLDWKYYVKVFPWSAVGVAAVAGYLLVPSRRATRVNPLLDGPNPIPTPSPASHEAPQSRGIVTSLLGFAANAVLRTAVTYAGQALGNYLAHLQLQQQPSSDTDVTNEDQRYAHTEYR